MILLIRRSSHQKLLRKTSFFLWTGAVSQKKNGIEVRRLDLSQFICLCFKKKQKMQIKIDFGKKKVIVFQIKPTKVKFIYFTQGKKYGMTRYTKQQS